MHPILIVSDLPFISETIELILQEEGFEAETFTTAKAVLDHLQSRATPCVVIVCHLHLAEAVLPAAVTMQATLPPIGWIFTTAGRMSPHSRAAAAMQQLPVTFLRKPFEYEELVNAIAAKMSELPPA